MTSPSRPWSVLVPVRNDRERGGGLEEVLLCAFVVCGRQSFYCVRYMNPMRVRERLSILKHPQTTHQHTHIDTRTS